MYLVKCENNTYRPAYNRDYEESAKVKEGEEVSAKRARNPKFHRKLFALLNLGFSNQDKFTDFEIYRQVTTMKAGFVKWVTGTDNKEHPLPESISFDAMGQARFEELYSAFLAVIKAELSLSDEEIQNNLINFY